MNMDGVGLLGQPAVWFAFCLLQSNRICTSWPLGTCLCKLAGSAERAVPYCQQSFDTSSTQYIARLLDTST